MASSLWLSIAYLNFSLLPVSCCRAMLISALIGLGGKETNDCFPGQTDETPMISVDVWNDLGHPQGALRPSGGYVSLSVSPRHCRFVEVGHARSFLLISSPVRRWLDLLA